VILHFQKHLLHVGEPKLAETPLLEARSLAMAVRMMAAAHELPKDAGSALDTVADLIFDKLIGLSEVRTRPRKLACKATEGAARWQELRLGTAGKRWSLPGNFRKASLTRASCFKLSESCSTVF